MSLAPLPSFLMFVLSFQKRDAQSPLHDLSPSVSYRPLSVTNSRPGLCLSVSLCLLVPLPQYLALVHFLEQFFLFLCPVSFAIDPR